RGPGGRSDRTAPDLGDYLASRARQFAERKWQVVIQLIGQSATGDWEESSGTVGWLAAGDCVTSTDSALPAST
ncbi:MAG: hypothetical protein ACRD0H_26255, partial [Actinomycetes bacterium]